MVSLRAIEKPSTRSQRADTPRLFWRLYRVLSKPLDELIGLLGLEKPAAPSVSLAGVKADAIILHWKPREQSKAVRHHVYINGVQGMFVKLDDNLSLILRIQLAQSLLSIPS